MKLGNYIRWDCPVFLADLKQGQSDQFCTLSLPGSFDPDCAVERAARSHCRLGY